MSLVVGEDDEVAGVLPVAVGRRRHRLLAATVLVAALGVQAEELSHEQELAAIRLQITRLVDDLERLDARSEDLASRLERTELELRLQESRLAEAQSAYALAQGELRASEARIAALGTEVAVLRARVKERLVALYQLGGEGYLRLLLAVEPGTDPLQAIRQLRFLVRRDTGTIERFRGARAELDAQLREREERRAELAEWLLTERQREEELVRVRRRQRSLLAAVEEERRALTIRTNELLDKERRLENLIGFLYNQSAEVVTGTPIQEFRGVLDWPLRGEILTRFGPREDPRYGTLVPHNGIEIRTPVGADVRVVFPGKVLFADPFEGFGFTAVVQHPDGVFTLYAGLGELSVQRMDMVSLGDRVGAAGATLYFEVRVESRPEDPLSWLR